MEKDKEKTQKDFKESSLGSSDSKVQSTHAGMINVVEVLFDLEDYRKKVIENADKKVFDVLTNSGPEHAKIIMSNIFRTAEKKVRVFAGNLRGEVSNGEYIEMLDKFLSAQKELEIKLEEEPDVEKSEAYKKIIEYKKKYPKKISIGIVDKKHHEKLKSDGKIFHFTVGDDRMFRFETDTDQYVAVANFNDKETSKVLIDRFNSIKTEEKTFEINQ